MFSGEKGFCKREWILFILFLLILEYSILDKVYVYGEDQKIVSYVGFAGTIVSIILAVLAIVYSYFQNFSQKRDSENLGNQLLALNKITGELNNSTVSFACEMKKVDVLNERLNKAVDSIKSHIDDGFVSIKNSLPDFDVYKSKTKSEVNLETSQVESFFKNLNLILHPVLAMLYFCRDSSISIVNLGIYHNDIVAKDYLEEDKKLYFFGIIYGFVQTLQSLSLLTISDDDLVSLSEPLVNIAGQNYEDLNFFKDSEQIRNGMEAFLRKLEEDGSVQ